MTRRGLTPFILACALCAAVGCSSDNPAANGSGSADSPRNIFAGEPFSPNDPYYSYDPAKTLHPGHWNLANQVPDDIHYTLPARSFINPRMARMQRFFPL